MCTQFGRTLTHQLATELQASRAWGLSRRKKEESPKKMDIHSSIITQVNRDNNEQINGYTIQSKDEKKRSFRGTKTKTDTQRAQFRSLLCCFSRPKKKNVLDHKHVPESMVPTTNGRTDHTPPASPSQETNANDVSLSNGDQTYLLASKCPSLGDKKCAVIDLDETLVHSSFKPISNADFIVPVEIEGTIHQVYVLKRPHVDEYLKRMGELYECVLFTASLAKYADPVADLLDKGGVFSSRLFRESCVFHRGNYVKDLSLIGRDLHKVIIVDNSPASYIFHPDNAVPVISWFDDPNDTELLDLIPFLEAIAKADNVYSVLNSQSFAHHTQKTSARLHQQQLIHQQQMQVQQQQCQTDTDDGDNEDSHRDSIPENLTAEQTIHQTSPDSCVGELKADNCSSTTNDCEPLIRPAVCNGSTPVTSCHVGSQEHGGPPTAPPSD